MKCSTRGQHENATPSNTTASPISLPSSSSMTTAAWSAWYERPSSTAEGNCTGYGYAPLGRVAMGNCRGQAHENPISAAQTRRQGQQQEALYMGQLPRGVVGSGRR